MRFENPLDWRNQLVTFKERSAWSVRSGSGAAPVNWVLLPMWRSAGDEGVGPCGPRAYAGCPDFIVFANRKGAFIYTGSGVPVWITKEIQTQSSSGPNRPTWDQINWAYEHLIVCAIDPESREVHFSVPFGGSTVPNKTFTVNYARGWDDPVHYSSFSGKEVTPPERKWTFSDWAGSSIMRVERPLTSPNPADPIDPRIAFSQLLIASPYADGTVNIQAPDEYDDNGVAINSYYDVSQIKAAAAINQFGGITINVKGQGKLSLSVIPLNGPLLPMRGIDLSADPRGFYKRETRANGRQFGLRVGNSNTQGAWFEMMECALFMKAQFPAENRDPGRAGP